MITYRTKFDKLYDKAVPNNPQFNYSTNTILNNKWQRTVIHQACNATYVFFRLLNTLKCMSV